MIGGGRRWVCRWDLELFWGREAGLDVSFGLGRGGFYGGGFIGVEVVRFDFFFGERDYV